MTHPVFLFQATIDEGGDLRSREYGVCEVGPFEARETLRLWLDRNGMPYTKIKSVPSTPGKLASLNLSFGCVGLVN